MTQCFTSNLLERRTSLSEENEHHALQDMIRAQLFTAQSQHLTTQTKKPFENIVGKGENAGYQHFLLFPQCFLPNQREKSAF